MMEQTRLPKKQCSIEERIWMMGQARLPPKQRSEAPPRMEVYTETFDIDSGWRRLREAHAMEGMMYI